MGLTAKSTGLNAVDCGISIKKENGNIAVALAGNPNVGKSTVFNALTGMKQHTGNWPGKTVTNATGHCEYRGKEYVFIDLPGTYSLLAHSTEEEIARDFICFGNSDCVAVVCDSTCLERNLNLVIQTLEITSNAVICVNLLDEAEKKGIEINFKKLEELLGVSVVGMTARDKSGLDEMMKAVRYSSEARKENKFKIEYDGKIETALSFLTLPLKEVLNGKINERWVALRLLEGDEKFLRRINEYMGREILTQKVSEALKKSREYLNEQKITAMDFKDRVVSAVVSRAEEISAETVTFKKSDCYERDRKIDRILTNKLFGFPIMILLLLLVFWITITGANVPSGLLNTALFKVGDIIREVFVYFKSPEWLTGILVDGVYKVLAWVVSVMLPPMAIFFPMFTLLEDSGYLPRVAFNLDKHFQKANACGKQALTMCMGFGCNAAGIVGCRIIDSPRERLIAILTNNFVPCNGRFPTIISIISMFFVGSIITPFQSITSAAFLTSVIVLGVMFTFLMSNLLSKTILKGMPSGFTLELPPYRRPQICKVIVRSIFDRTLFVLGRAIVVAIPAGFIIWLMANITLGDATLLSHCAEFLDPFARFIGMDGVILLAFILGFPANEIVVPIMIMTYMAQGSLLELDDLNELKALFIDNGWTWITALCTILFSLFHWPCSTTCLTIKKETGSLKWTVLAFLLPTLTGFIICGIVANLCRLFA